MGVRLPPSAPAFLSSKHEWVESVGPGTRLDIQIIEPNVTHTLLVAQLKQWLDRPPTSAADSVKKQKLKELLARSPCESVAFLATTGRARRV